MTYEDIQQLLNDLTDRIKAENKDPDTAHVTGTIHKLAVLTAIKSEHAGYVPVPTIDKLAVLLGAAMEVGYWMRQLELEAKN